MTGDTLLSRFPRPRWPHRKSHPVPDMPPVEPGGVLRVFRAAALAGLSAVITAASSASFAESYRGLWLWAGHHSLDGFWKAAFPLQVDAFIVAGELTLFLAMVDRWTRRERAGAWVVALLGLAVSVAGNVGHVAAHDLQSRGTAAVPPLSAFCALWLGLTVLKRIIQRASVPLPDADVSPRGEDTAPDPLLIAADTAFPDVAAGAPVPSLRSIRRTLRVGETRARRVRDHLGRVHEATLTRQGAP